MLQRTGEGRQPDHIAQLTSSERIFICNSEDFTPRGVDIHDQAPRIDGDQAGCQTACERRCDALQLVGARLLAVVQPLELFFLRLQRGDRASKCLDQIRGLFLISGAFAELLFRIAEHLLDRPRDPRQVEQEQHRSETRRGDGDEGDDPEAALGIASLRGVKAELESADARQPDHFVERSTPRA